MPEYNHSDFMPKEDTTTQNHDPVTPTPDKTEHKESVANPEVGVVTDNADNCAWARYVSAIFSPVIIPTYTIALALWITPLSHISENTRLMAALMVLVITALLPTAYIASMVRIGRRKSMDNATRTNRIVPCITFVICQLVAAYYLYYIYAPDWLVMILVAGAGSTLTFFVFNFFSYLSGHLCAMGGMTAVVFYLGRNELLDMAPTPWLIGVILLSGLIGSARIALDRHRFSEVSLGYIVGAVVTYIILNIHFFSTKVLIPVQS